MYTSYFANLRKLPKDIVPIAICAKPPNWYGGARYNRLAPPYDVLMGYKRDGDAEKYVREYKKRVLDALNPDRVIDELFRISGGKAFAMLCYEKPDDFCHRHIVAEWLREHDFEVEEWEEN